MARRVLAGALAALALTASAQAATCEPDAAWPATDPARAAEVVRLVNEHRASRGRATLQPSASLVRAAEWKARNMAFFGYLAHADPDGRSAYQRRVDCGYPASAGSGENLARGYSSPSAVVSAWLGSAGHRANIEATGWRGTGVGVATSAGGIVYWAQEFGSVVEATPEPALGGSAAASPEGVEERRPPAPVLAAQAGLTTPLTFVLRVQDSSRASSPPTIPT